jgi:hypothetical protein
MWRITILHGFIDVYSGIAEQEGEFDLLEVLHKIALTGCMKLCGMKRYVTL